MLTALRFTIIMLPAVPALVLVGWAAARQGDRVLVVMDAALTVPQQEDAIREALTVDEYVEYVEYVRRGQREAAAC